MHRHRLRILRWTARCRGRASASADAPCATWPTSIQTRMATRALRATSARCSVAVPRCRACSTRAGARATWTTAARATRASAWLGAASMSQRRARTATCRWWIRLDLLMRILWARICHRVGTRATLRSASRPIHLRCHRPCRRRSRHQNHRRSRSQRRRPTSRRCRRHRRCHRRRRRRRRHHQQQ